MPFEAKKIGWLIIRRVREYVKESGHRGVVVGVSGGLDSAVCVALAVRALGKKNVLALVMPNGKESERDIEDAVTVCKWAGVKYKLIGIEEATGAIERVLLRTREKKCRNIDSGNVAARTRMTVLYGTAACKRYLVLGTGNKSEILLGYFTKHGDGGVDLLPIGDLYKHEVRELAHWLGIPEKIIKKAPSPGLWKGQTDEGELGFSYEIADRILHMFLERGMRGDGIIREIGYAKTVKKIYRMVKKSSHKRCPPRVLSIKTGTWR